MGVVGTNRKPHTFFLIGQHLYPHPARNGSHSGPCFHLVGANLHWVRVRVRIRVGFGVGVTVTVTVAVTVGYGYGYDYGYGYGWGWGRGLWNIVWTSVTVVGCSPWIVNGCSRSA